MLDTGISGNFMSKHYFDMNERFKKGDLIKLGIHPENIYETFVI